MVIYPLLRNRNSNGYVAFALGVRLGREIIHLGFSRHKHRDKANSFLQQSTAVKWAVRCKNVPLSVNLAKP